METLVELTYQAQVTPWLQLQPVMEFVLNPGGGITNPDAPSEHLSNEMVAGPALEHHVLTSRVVMKLRPARARTHKRQSGSR